jgi:hypothetical protein
MVIQDRIVERDSAQVRCEPMRPPKKVVAMTGFPVPPVSPVLAHPSPNTSSDLMVSTRDLAKLAWTNPVSSEEDGPTLDTHGDDRYDFEGRVIVDEDDPIYKSELYHHGKEPGRPGYTLEELFHLSQSGFAAQKSLAIRTIGAIASNSSPTNPRKWMREMHGLLIGTWKAHVRLSVACSDVSIGVKSESWRALLNLITHVDIECGCVVDDLVSIPEFYGAIDPDNMESVTVFAYMMNHMERRGADEEIPESTRTTLHDMVSTACGHFGICSSDYACGVSADFSKVFSGDLPDPAEIFATLADRLACINEDPLTDTDIDLFESILLKCRPNLPFLDEFNWATRANFVTQAFMGGVSSSEICMRFLGKLVFAFSSSLFPAACRAGIWTNLEVVLNISRVLGCDHPLALLGNHDLIDFECEDIAREPSRDSATVARAIRGGCRRFLEEIQGDEELHSKELIEVAEKIVRNLEDI